MASCPKGAARTTPAWSIIAIWCCETYKQFKILRGQLAQIAKELGSSDQSDSKDDDFFGKPAASPSP